MLKIIALSAIVLSLVACGPSGTEPKNQTTETAPQTAPAKPDASAGIMDAQRDALEKAKEVQGVVDTASDEMDKAVEKNTQ